jgi:tetratricopeptide (TPR) repeat protein
MMQERHQLLNAFLEAHIAGEAYAGISSQILTDVERVYKLVFKSPLVPEALRLLLAGDYLGVLTQSALSRDIVSVVVQTTGKGTNPAGWYDALTITLTRTIMSANGAAAVEELDTYVLICGIAALCAFTQVNVAGLPLAAVPESEATAASATLERLLSDVSVSRQSIAALRLNGEDSYPCVYFPLLVLFARAILNGVYDRRALRGPSAFTLPAARVWALRALAAHNSTLLDNTAVVSETAKLVFKDVELAYRLGAFRGVRSYPTVVSDAATFSGTEIDTESDIDAPLAAPGGMAPLYFKATASDASASDNGTDTDAVAVTGTAGNRTGGINGGDGDDDDDDDDDDDGNNGGHSQMMSAGMVPHPASAAAYHFPSPADAASGHSSLSASPADAAAAVGHSSLSEQARRSVHRSVRRALRTTICLEAAQLARAYWQFPLSKRLLAAATAAAGCTGRLTGVLGKRTRYQATAKAQLVLIGATESEMLSLPGFDEEIPICGPVTLGNAIAVPADSDIDKRPTVPVMPLAGALDGTYIADAPLDSYDDTFLTLAAVDKSARNAAIPLLPAAARESAKDCFSALGQAAALAYAEHVRSAQANGELGSQEMLAYVYAPITQELRRAGYNDHLDAAVLPKGTGLSVPGSVAGAGAAVDAHAAAAACVWRSDLLKRPAWGTLTHALYLRSVMEQGDFRRQLRSFAQLETLGALYPPSLSVLAPASLAVAVSPAQSDGSVNALPAPQIPSRASSLAAVRWRMNGLFTSALPPWWLSRRGYADIALRSNLRQAALDVFVQIGLWESVIETYVALGRNAQAERLVRSRLPRSGYLEAALPINNVGIDAGAEIGTEAEPDSASATAAEPGPGPVPPVSSAAGAALAQEAELQARFGAVASSASASLQKRGLDLPEHKLWSLLGDIRRDPAYYTKAWEVSEGSYPRAQRSLGSLAMSARHFAQAYAHFQLSLSVNPANPEIWFVAGACALEMRRWDDAIACFTATVNAKPLYSEGWNNLAAAHLHKGNRRSAFSALEHTVRLNRKSWKVWENYLNCAMDLGKYQEAASALAQLCDLRGQTDAGTLLPVQFSGHQAQMHMMALGQLTKAAVEDALAAFKKNAAEHNRAVAVAGVSEQELVLQQSFLSNKLLEVLAKFENIASSMAAQESSLGGRKRGGGEAAGAGNSVTALLEVRRQANRDRLARLQEARAQAEARGESVPADLMEQIARHEAKDEASNAAFGAAAPTTPAAAAGGLTVSSPVGEEDEEDAEAGDTVGELASAGAIASTRAGTHRADTAAAGAAQGGPQLQVHALPSGLTSEQVPANSGLFQSLGQQYQIFIQDCLARVLAAVQQYAAAASACEKRCALFMRHGSGWEDKEEVVDEVEAAMLDAVRNYTLAHGIERHVEAGTGAGTGATGAGSGAVATAARLFVSRTLGALELAAKNTKSARVEAAAAQARKALARIQQLAPEPVLAPAAGAAADGGYDAYGGGGYEDWR